MNSENHDTKQEENKTKDVELHSDLKHALDKGLEKIERKNQDMVIAVEGEEGTGKSSLALTAAKYIDPDFRPEKQVAFTGKEFREKASKLDEFKPIIFDEAIESLFSRSAMSKENQRTIKFLRKCRDLNLIIFLNMPQLSELEKPIRKHRLRAVFRCVKQGWAWIYGKKKSRRIVKGSKGLEYPDYDFRASWMKPENNIPEVWSSYKELKMTDLQSLQDNQRTEVDDGVKRISTGEFAERVGVSLKTVRRWAEKDIIECSKLPNGDRRIPENQVEKVLD